LLVAIAIKTCDGGMARLDAGALRVGHDRGMAFLDPAFLPALLAIVVIDIALAGDNAIVIALAARELPPRLRKRAIAWGAIGAVAVRCAMTLGVVWLLQVPGLMAAGGAVLLAIAYKLGRPAAPAAHHAIRPAPGFWPAMRTIVVADAAMGIDNVLAVAGAAHGSFALVVAGLAISIPIVVWGSALVLKLMDRWPWIMQVGVAVLAGTAAKMIVDEPLFAEAFTQAPARFAVYALAIGGVFLAITWATRRTAAAGA
jgi:YjbE family integral membrane protein